MYSRKNFDNGMVLQSYKEQSNMPARDVSIDISIPYGLVDEVPQAHFLEHLAFKSNHIRNQKEMMYLLEGNGINCEAFTFQDHMNFHIVSPPEHIEKAIQILYDTFVNEKFVPSEVESEKKVIFRELLRDQSMPYYSIGKKVRRAIFGGHPLDIEEETTESIFALSAEDLAKSKQKYFGPSGLSIGVVGDFDESKTTELISKTFGNLEQNGAKHRVFEKPKIKYSKETELSDGKTGVVVVFPALGFNDKDIYALDFLAHALGGNTKEYKFINRLTQEIRVDKGLAYAAYAYYPKYNGVGHIAFESQGMKKEDINAVEEIILANIERIKNEKMGAAEFKRAKTSFIIGKERSRYSNITKMSDWLSLCGLYGMPWEFEHFKEEVETLTPEKIMETANKYFDGNYFVGEIVPRS